MGDRLRRRVECSPTPGVMCVEVGCGVRGRAPIFTASYARRVHCQGGAAHQWRVRSRGSLLVASISDGFATGAYGPRALRAEMPGGLPRGSEATGTQNSEPRTARERSDRAYGANYKTSQ